MEASWGLLNVTLALLEVSLGSWSSLEALRGHFGALGGHLQALGGHFGTLGGHLGTLGGHLGDI